MLKVAQSYIRYEVSAAAADLGTAGQVLQVLSTGESCSQCRCHSTSSGRQPWNGIRLRWQLVTAAATTELIGSKLLQITMMMKSA